MKTRKLNLFRLAAVLVGIMPFLLVEGGLRLFDIGRPGKASDSLSGFNRNLPLFERQGEVYRTSLAREPFFCAQEFPVVKPPNGFRVFCFGGSTVHGHPYQSDTAFPKWLEMELAGGDPGKRCQAVNCGGVSYASYRLAPLVKEVLGYQPDLIIVMTGENEFLEDRTYQSVKARSATRAWLEDAVHSLRIVNVARRWIHGARLSASRDEATQLSPEIKTRLDERSGYASYHRDDAWHDRVAAQFEESIRAIIAQCRAGGVPILLVKPGSNLRDCAPFKSEHHPNLSVADERAWQTAFDAATAKEEAEVGQASRLPPHSGVPPSQNSPNQSTFAGETPALAAETAAPLSPSLTSALELYRKAETIDGEYALLNWRIARVLDRLAKKSEAFEYYLKAREYDVCQLRTPKRHELVFDRIAAETKTPLVDAAALLAAKSPDGIPGNNWYLDHVHPTIGGHQKIAQTIAARVREIGIVPKGGIWPEDQRREAYRQHLRELGVNYLADGRRRVEWLENWARRERLLDETLPKDTRGFLQLGFRRLDFGDEEGAWESFREALKRDPAAATPLREHAEELVSEGREEAATELLRRLETAGAK
jgi:lysophospholipase L1-like esterase